LQGEGPKRYGEDPKRPWELEGVAEIMAGAARGETMRRIAEHMQALAFKLRRGKRWNPGTVWRVIRRQEFLKGKRAHFYVSPEPEIRIPLTYPEAEHAQGI
jgi:hypothetical protein